MSRGNGRFQSRYEAAEIAGSSLHGATEVSLLYIQVFVDLHIHNPI